MKIQHWPISLAFALLLSGAHGHASAPNDCGDKFTRLFNSRGADSYEARLLRDFDVEKLLPQQIYPVPHHDLIYLAKHGEESYYLRVELVNRRHLEREQFAVAFLNASTGTKVADARLLDAGDSNAVLAKIRQRSAEEFHDIEVSAEIEKGGRLDPNQYRVSVSAAYAGQNGAEVLADHFPNLSIRTLREVPLEKIPAHIRTQVANLWSSYTILGIPDFHQGNWIVRDGKVVGLDLSYRHPRRTKGPTPLQLRDQQDPFWAEDFSQKRTEELLRYVSPEHRKYLRSLDAEKIRKLATQTGYKINHPELTAILRRLNYFLSLPSPTPAP